MLKMIQLPQIDLLDQKVSSLKRTFSNHFRDKRDNPPLIWLWTSSKMFNTSSKLHWRSTKCMLMFSAVFKSMFIVFVPFLFSLSPSIRIRLKEQIQTNQNLNLKALRVKIETFLNWGSDWPVMISISHNSKSKTSQFDFFF